LSSRWTVVFDVLKTVLFFRCLKRGNNITLIIEIESFLYIARI